MSPERTGLLEFHTGNGAHVGLLVEASLGEPSWPIYSLGEVSPRHRFVGERTLWVTFRHREPESISSLESVNFDGSTFWLESGCTKKLENYSETQFYGRTRGEERMVAYR